MFYWLGGVCFMWDRLLVFFFKQKTAYEMRISDWSADVCSSDLPARLAIGGDSAGANLSFATALRLRDRGEGGIVRAILSNYGYFTPDVSDRAEARFGGPGSIMDRAEAESYYVNYLTDWDRETRDPLDRKSTRLNSSH